MNLRVETGNILAACESPQTGSKSIRQQEHLSVWTRPAEQPDGQILENWELDHLT